jgi:3-deoxy-D-manno-octulosonic-acid transferase
MKKEDSDNNLAGDFRLPSRPVSSMLYNWFISLFSFSIRLYARFNSKAKKWIDGRRNWEQNIKEALQPGEKRVWIHCSSMGEFEQAKPLAEALKKQFPVYKIVITFFSPSGFDACKRNDIVDYVFYLPVDNKQNAERFIAVIEPSLVLFVKYEFWYYYLAHLHKRRIPVALVSGAFREGQVFFKWYGGLFRDMLQCFSFFFLQDAQSEEMLHKAGFYNNILISGDTRYDRVSAIAKNIAPIAAIEQFKGQNKILIAGSTWPGDETVLRQCISILPSGWKLIIVPHETGAAHIRKVQELFGKETILFSDLDAENTGSDRKILIINNVGMLSRLFAYGDIAFIGGGFQKGGIHNILEPAVFGLPVVFGPIYEKFVEAKELVSLQYVFPVNNVMESNAILKKLIIDETYRNAISGSLKEFMHAHTGATKTIINEIIKERWLYEDGLKL